MKKRILSALLSLLMIVSLVPVGVYAEGEVLTIYADSAEIAYGTESVTVNVYIKNNPGISGLQFGVAYDDSALTLVNATDENSEVRLAATLNPNYTKNPYVVNFFRTANDTSNGILFTMEFEVKEDAEPGVYDIDLVVSKDSDVINQNRENVEYAVENASITILGEDFNSKIKVSDKMVLYDGEVHTLELAGANYLPENYNVEYYCGGEVFEGAKNAGTYDIEAILTAPGYNQKTFDATLTIDKKGLTYAGAVGSREYDGTTYVNFTANEVGGMVEGDDVTVEVNAQMASANVARSVAVVMSFEISGEDADNYKLPAVPSLKGEIKQRAVIVTANGSKKVGDEDPVLEPEIISGSLVEGDEFTGAPSRETGEEPGVYATKKGTLALSSNYKLTFTAGEFEIFDKATQNFKAYITMGDDDDVDTVEYGSDEVIRVGLWSKASECVPDAIVKAVITSSNDDVVTFEESSPHNILITGAGEAVITVTVPGDDDYAPFEIKLPITVTKRAITITADNKTKKIGNETPEFTYTLGGAVANGDELDVNLWYDGSEDLGNHVINVEYEITNEDSYDVTVNEGILTITDKLPQENISVTGVPESLTYGDEGFAVEVATTDDADFLGDVTLETSDVNVLSVDGMNVTVKGAGKATLTVTANGNDDYADFEYTKEITVEKREITVSADAVSKYVGQDDPELTYEITEGSLVPRDDFTGALTRTKGETAGKKYEIKLGTLSLGDNYEITFVKNYVYVLAKINQEFEVDFVTEATYGELGFMYEIDEDAEGSFNRDGILTVTSSNAEVAEVGDNGFVFIKNAGKSSITVSVSGNYMYNDWKKTYTLTVAKKPLTITANDASKRVDSTDPELGYDVEGETVNGDILEVTVAREQGEDIGIYEIIPSYTLTNSENYDVTVNNGTFTILDKYPQDNIKISGEPVDLEYGDEGFTFVVETTDGKDLLGDVIITTSNPHVLSVDGYNVTVKNAGKATIFITVKGDEDHVDYEYERDFTVYKRNVTVAAKAQSKYAGQDDPELEYEIIDGSLVGDDDFTGALTRTRGETAGKKYEIKLGTLSLGDNYEIDFVKEYLTVLKKLDQSVATEAPVSAVYGDTDLVYLAEKNEESNADAEFVFSSSNESVAVIDENSGAITICSAGKAVFTATLAGNYKYNDWERKVTLTVAKKDLVITPDAKDKKIGNDDPALTFTATETAYDDVLEVTLTREEGEDLGIYDITATYNLDNAESYNVKLNEGVFTILDKYPQTITAEESVELTYGDEAYQLTATSDLDGAVAEYALDSEEVVKLTEDNKLEIVGAGEAVVTVTFAGNDEYASATKKIKVTVLPKEVTVEIQAEKNVIYYGEEFEYTVKYTGFVYDEDESVLESEAAVTVPKDAGEYTLDLDGAAAKNYTFTYIPFELTIKPAELELIEIDFYNREFFEGMDRTVDYISYSLSVINGIFDDKAVEFEVMAETRTEITEPGTYPVQITVSITGRDSSNFTITNEGKYGFDNEDYTVEILEVYGAEELAGQLEGYLQDGYMDGGMSNIVVNDLPENFTMTIKEPIADGENVLVDQNGNRLADGEGTFDIVYVITDTREGGSSIEIPTTVTLLPLDKFNVTVVAENGTVTGEGEYTILDEITLTATPASKYKFSQWEINGEKVSTSATYTFKLTHHMTYGADLELEAVFKKSNPGGGGGGSTTYYYVTFNIDDQTSEKVKVEGGDKVMAPEDPVKEGFTFEGWFTDVECTAIYDFNKSVSKSFDLYAKWTEVETDDGDDGKTENGDDNNDEDKTEEKWTNPFTDVKEDDWFYASVEYALNKGLFKGVSETEFAPKLNLTRAMLVTVLYRAEGEPEVSEKAGFGDVSEDAYYAKAVDWAKANSIVLGVTETEFAPDVNITREQIATIMFRYSAFKGMAAVTLEENLHFDDADTISEYAISALNWAVGTELIKGRTISTLNPRDNATRAEAATILMRYFSQNEQ